MPSKTPIPIDKLIMYCHNPKFLNPSLSYLTKLYAGQVNQGGGWAGWGLRVRVWLICSQKVFLRNCIIWENVATLLSYAYNFRVCN